MPLILQNSALTLPDGGVGTLEQKHKAKSSWKKDNRERSRELERQYYLRLKERAKTDALAQDVLNRKRKRGRERGPRIFSQVSKIKRSENGKARFQKIKADPLKYAVLLARGRRWRKNNSDKISQLKRAWRNAQKDNPNWVVEQRARSRMRRALSLPGTSGKCDKTQNLIGCSPAQLRAHIESLFLPGMSWANRHQWHIDHIRPCSSFDLTLPEQQRCCFHYTNLQPLWAADNLRKSNKCL